MKSKFYYSELFSLNYVFTTFQVGFPGGASGKESSCQFRRHKRGQFDPWIGKDPLEKGTATHSSNLAWRIPWTEEPGGLESIELQSVGHK